MRFLVVGAGAIGCLVGGRLADTGHDVTLVTREWLASAIASSGLRLNIGGEAFYVPHIAAVTSVKQALLEFGPFDLALFTMKSYDTKSGIRELQDAAERSPAVMSLQNGVGNEQLLRAAFGAEQVIAGVITSPAEMPLPAVVRASPGAVGLAPLDPGTPVSPLATVLESAGFETRVYGDWRGLKWSKLLLNMLGNATSAILDWPPARIFSHPRLFDLERQAWEEARRVTRRQDISVVSLPGYPLTWVARIMDWFPGALLQPLLSRAVARGRGGKMPSLHIDLERGKTRSEITVLNGAVVAAGQHAGVLTPVNAALTETLLEIVQGKRDWDTFCGRPDRLMAVVESQRVSGERVNG